MQAPESTGPSTHRGASRPVAAAFALLAGLGSCVAGQFATVWLGPVSMLFAVLAGGLGAAAAYWHLRKEAPRRQPPAPGRVIGAGLQVWGLMTAAGAVLGAFVGWFAVRVSPGGAGLGEALIDGARLGAPVGAAVSFALGGLTILILAVAFPEPPSETPGAGR